MRRDSLKLLDLPIEVLGGIFRLLDPIGLISVSQSNRALKAIINPKPIHFIERLLAAECLEQYGGNTLIFRSRDNDLQPSWSTESDQWEMMRWACTRCMRLLSHINFDNRSIFRLGLRKPLLNSPASEVATTWEPSGDRHSNHQHQKSVKEAAELKAMKRRYAIAVTRNWGISKFSQPAAERLAIFQNAGMEQFKALDLEEFIALTFEEEIELLDRAAWAIDQTRCGFKRRLRTCNECRYQRGDFKHGIRSDGDETQRDRGHQQLNSGTITVPIIRSRPMFCVSLIERNFPGFWQTLENDKRPVNNPPLQRVYRDDATDQPWATYMVRCPACAVWQELRAMRCGGIFPHWRPDLVLGQETWDGETLNANSINSMTCNSCYAKKNGRPALGEVLLQRWKTLVKWDLELFTDQLNWWSEIKYRKQDYKKAGCWRTIKKNVLAGLPESLSMKWALANVALLRERHQRYMVIHEQLLAKKVAFLCTDNSASSRIYKYEDTEAYWLWLWRCREELQESSEPLVRWAIGESDSE